LLSFPVGHCKRWSLPKCWAQNMNDDSNTVCFLPVLPDTEMPSSLARANTKPDASSFSGKYIGRKIILIV
jgi:hypothetical protein